MIMLKCPSCNWVHFGRTLEEITTEIEKFNSYYYSQPKDIQEMFRGPSKIKDYENCFRCGKGYETFIPAEADDVPFGSTLQPIRIV